MNYSLTQEETSLPPNSNRSTAMELGRLRAERVLGRGGKGVVFLVRDLASGREAALKAVSRSALATRAATGDDEPFRRIWLERDVLLSLRHPLLPRLHAFLSTDKIFGFVIDPCPGGSLSSLPLRHPDLSLSDSVIRFYAAELVIVIHHLHSHGIVYRDLKPDNILIQSNGHIMVVDFDLSAWSTSKSNSFVGTEDYVAPEVVSGAGHDSAVDWWGLGVVLYELLYGRTPFRGRNREETFRFILHRAPALTGELTPLRDLIRRLLCKDPRRRPDVKEIKAHPFFAGVNWSAVAEIARPPYIPLTDDDQTDDASSIDVEAVVEMERVTPRGVR
ncbi:serine/threonine-protein kinase OXI1-like [Wolffia australiana]